MKRIVIETYHDNGKISYRATRGILYKSDAHLYPKRRIHPDGHQWIYVGLAGKWDEKGKPQWLINFNEQGEIL